MMDNRIQKIWIIVAAVWLMALGLTYWNSTRIDEVIALREKMERYAKEHGFQKRYAKKLAWAAQYDRTQRLSVVSTKLGIIRIRNKLYALAEEIGLRDVDINTRMGQAMDGKLPISLKAKGRMPDAVAFLNILNGYAYLPVANVRITVYFDVGIVEIESKIIFHFSVDRKALQQHETRIDQRQTRSGHTS